MPANRGVLVDSAVDLKFAALMSFISRLCNFFMTLILLGLIASLAARHAQPTASPYVSAIRAAPSIPSGTPFTVQPGQTGPTAFDILISSRIKQNQFHIMEGYAWARTGAADDADKKLISDMYNAGADKVYMDGFNMYVQLPADVSKRAACVEVSHTFHRDHGLPDNAAAYALNYQYIVMNLLSERLKAIHHKN